MAVRKYLYTDNPASLLKSRNFQNHAPVLPARRPLRAESYVSKARFTTQPRGFILPLALRPPEIIRDHPGLEYGS